MSSDEGEILMGCWDCSSCGDRGQRGDAYECQDCGAPRPDDVHFYLPDNPEVVTDEAGIAAAEAGADWQCAFCNSWVPATVASCINCDASLSDSRRRQQTGEYDTQESVAPWGRLDDDSKSQRYPDSGRKPNSAPLWVIGILVCAAMLVAGIWGVSQYFRRQAFEAKVAAQQAVVKRVSMAAKKAEQQHQPAIQRLATARTNANAAKKQLEASTSKLEGLQTVVANLQRATEVLVAGHRWKVVIDVEKCIAKSGEGWEKPDGAFDVQTSEKVHHTEKVLDRVDTLYRTETYRAQDGFRTETYTERVRAGTRRVQSGTTRRSLGNGRFKRVPKYRTETIYKTVTKTRQKPRMVTKTRQVPYEKKIYRDEPVKKPWYVYKTKQWVPAPRLTRSGNGREPVDPEDTPPKKSGDEIGDRRVRQKTIEYTLSLSDVTDSAKKQTIKVSLEEWNSIEDGAKMLLSHTQLLTRQQRDIQLTVKQKERSEAERQVSQLESQHNKLADQVPKLEKEIGPMESKLKSLQKQVRAEKAALDQLMRAGY